MDGTRSFTMSCLFHPQLFPRREVDQFCFQDVCVCVPIGDGISFPPPASLSQPVFLPISPFASSLFALHLSSSFLTTQCSIATKALGWRHAVLYCGEHGRLILINVAETPLKKAPWLSSRNWQCFKSYPLHGRKH